MLAAVPLIAAKPKVEEIALVDPESGSTMVKVSPDTGCWDVCEAPIGFRSGTWDIVKSHMKQTADELLSREARRSPGERERVEHKLCMLIAGVIRQNVIWSTISSGIISLRFRYSSSNCDSCWSIPINFESASGGVWACS